MARRNKPYLPLYVQDFLTDEKLIECSAESTGVYIRLMCIMHKSEPYGTILLKQKDKQNASTIKNFACKLLRQMPYSAEIIERSLQELINEKVLTLDGEMLFQKRMVEDKKLSDIKAAAGSAGGSATQSANRSAKAKYKAGAKAESKANTDIDIDNDIDIINTGLLTEEEQDALQSDLNAVFDKARYVGFKCTPQELDALNLMVADYGKDAVLLALDKAGEASAPKIGYIKGIFKNDPTGGTKQKQADKPKGKTVIEQQYNQRDYTPEQAKQYTELTPEEIAEAKKYET